MASASASMASSTAVKTVVPNPVVNTYFCYLLRSNSMKHTGDIYIGFTNNPIRRLRQHNGLIGAGAKKTSKKRPWSMIACVYGFPSKVVALQFEWCWQYPRQSRLMKGVVNSRKYPTGAAGRVAILYEMIRRPPFMHYPLHIHYSTIDYYNTYHERAIKAINAHDKSIHINDVLPVYMDVIAAPLEEIPALQKRSRKKKATDTGNNDTELCDDNDIDTIDELDDDDIELDNDNDVDINEIDQDVFVLSQSTNIVRTASDTTYSQIHKPSLIAKTQSTHNTNNKPQISVTPGEASECHICGETQHTTQSNNTNLLTRGLEISADTPITDVHSHRSAMIYCYHCGVQSHAICLHNYHTVQQYNKHQLPTTLPSTVFRDVDWLQHHIWTSATVLHNKLMPTTVQCVSCHKPLHWPLLIDNMFQQNTALRKRIEKYAKHAYLEARDTAMNKAIEVARERRHGKKSETQSTPGKKSTPQPSPHTSSSPYDIDSIHSDSSASSHKHSSPSLDRIHTQRQYSQMSHDSIESI